MGYSWSAHVDVLTKLVAIPARRLLISVSKDKFLRVWYLPEVWSAQGKEKRAPLTKAELLERLADEKHVGAEEDEEDVSWVQSEPQPRLRPHEETKVDDEPRKSSHTTAQTSAQTKEQTTAQVKKEETIERPRRLNDDEDLDGWAN
eukprot:TRINITY_DN8521_c0_g1_i1.p1 TRINITY_DN8521_c0_g1~~TRINITY_DN8521_c0_g1_i1.p1  ORF type:complete len:146 (-),score=44.15 TRINITY_DN8521_c0_g1_i1:47-484(-)